MARPPASGTDTARTTSVTIPAQRTPDLDVSPLSAMLSSRGGDVLNTWVAAQLSSEAFRDALVLEDDVRRDSAEMLGAFQRAVGAGAYEPTSPGAQELGRLLERMSKDRARQGFSPSQTAVAVFSLKEALGAVLTSESEEDPVVLADQLRVVDRVVDDLGLRTFEAFVAGREELIRGQQQTMLDLSTPVVKLWDGIVAVPLIGTLDSGRTQLVMESLLQTIVDTESKVAIVDITGVSMVDTLVAQHLLKTVAATRLMGADCIISGIRPQIAQTMVHLGVELGEVVTKATLADAFRVALTRVGSTLAET